MPNTRQQEQQLARIEASAVRVLEARRALDKAHADLLRQVRKGRERELSLRDIGAAAAMSHEQVRRETVVHSYRCQHGSERTGYTAPTASCEQRAISPCTWEQVAA